MTEAVKRQKEGQAIRVKGVKLTDLDDFELFHYLVAQLYCLMVKIIMIQPRQNMYPQ
jgi:hypothetical protein